MFKKIRCIVPLFLFIACAPPELSPEQSLALKQAQTRQYEVSYLIAWQSTIGFLQDNYYDIGQANKESLILTASKKKSSQDNMKELPITDLKKNSIVTLTIFFDQIDESNIKIRANANWSRDDGTGLYQMGAISIPISGKKSQSITELATYKVFHDNLSREIQRRWVAEKMRLDSKKN